MARAKAINVKIPTVRVIAGLEEALATLEADYATQNAKEAKHTLAYEAWKKEIGEWAIANFSKSENLRTNYPNAIRLLKMTDEETVSTSTYNAIAQYL